MNNRCGGTNHVLCAYWESPPTYDIHNTQYEKMKNEPNFNTPNKSKRHPAMPDSTNNQLSLINNQWEAPIFHKKTRTFQKKSKKIQKIPKIHTLHTFCNFLTLTHLTPCTTKAYITFSTKNTLQGRDSQTVPLAKKNEKQTQFNYPLSLRGAKRRGNLNPHTQRPTGHGSRINMQNKPNFATQPNGSRFMQNKPNLQKTTISACATWTYINIPKPAMLVSTNNQ
jgi:hypothetical protein